jgi:hypothetical protein
MISWGFGGIALQKLPEDNHCLFDETAKFVTLNLFKMLFGVHEVEKQVDAALV